MIQDYDFLNFDNKSIEFKLSNATTAYNLKLMEPNSENVQYQTGGYAPYDPNYDAYNAKPAEPMMQPQYANNEPPAFGNDVENQKENLDSDVPVDYLIRRGFIIKTYGILLTQLIITGFFICLSFVSSFNDFIKIDDFAR